MPTTKDFWYEIESPHDLIKVIGGTTYCAPVSCDNMYTLDASFDVQNDAGGTPSLKHEVPTTATASAEQGTFERADRSTYTRPAYEVNPLIGPRPPRRPW